MQDNAVTTCTDCQFDVVAADGVLFDLFHPGGGPGGFIVSGGSGGGPGGAITIGTGPLPAPATSSPVGTSQPAGPSANAHDAVAAALAAPAPLERPAPSPSESAPADTSDHPNAVVDRPLQRLAAAEGPRAESFGPAIEDAIAPAEVDEAVLELLTDLRR